MFGGVWILHPDVSEFEFYSLYLGVIGFYFSKFESVEFYTLKFQNLGV